MKKLLFTVSLLAIMVYRPAISGLPETIQSNNTEACDKLGQIAVKHKRFWEYRKLILACNQNFTDNCKAEFGDANTIILTLGLTNEMIVPLQQQFRKQAYLCH